MICISPMKVIHHNPSLSTKSANGSNTLASTSPLYTPSAYTVLDPCSNTRDRVSLAAPKVQFIENQRPYSKHTRCPQHNICEPSSPAHSSSFTIRGLNGSAHFQQIGPLYPVIRARRLPAVNSFLHFRQMNPVRFFPVIPSHQSFAACSLKFRSTVYSVRWLPQLSSWCARGPSSVQL